MRVRKVALETGDPDVAREVLDRFYDPNGEGQWTASHELGNGESILRATIELQGGLITVETLSEPRVERVLDVLLAEIDGITVVSDDRRDFDPSIAPPGPRQPPMSIEDPAVKEALRTFIAERERIWCDEEIPALGGRTPRQAAADPVGREALDRLLGEYGSTSTPIPIPSWSHSTPIVYVGCSGFSEHRVRHRSSSTVSPLGDGLAATCRSRPTEPSSGVHAEL